MQNSLAVWATAKQFPHYQSNSNANFRIPRIPRRLLSSWHLDHPLRLIIRFEQLLDFTMVCKAVLTILKDTRVEQLLDFAMVCQAILTAADIEESLGHETDCLAVGSWTWWRLTVGVGATAWLYNGLSSNSDSGRHEQLLYITKLCQAILTAAQFRDCLTLPGVLSK